MATITVSYRNAIDDTVALLQRGAQGVLHLGGGDVLALPLVRVAGAVAEVQVAELVRNQDITAYKRSVSLTEHVADQLLVAVALKR